MSTAKANVFCSDLSTVQKEMQSCVTPEYSRKKDGHWILWIDFCVSQAINPFLTGIQDPIPYLQVFAQRYRDGRIAPGKKAVRSRTVSDALRSVGQKFSRLGSPDPRFDSTGSVDFRLQSQFKSFEKADAPSCRVKPVPITLVLHALEFAFHQYPTRERQAVANMICLAFFFCLRPGEYTGTTRDDQAFAIADLTLFLGEKRLCNATSPDAEILAATAMHLTFTTQKNGDKGTVVAHALSGHILCCPVRSAIRQLTVHRLEATSLPTPLCLSTKLATYYNSNHVNVPVTASMVTATMRCHATILRPQTGIDPLALSARSLRAGGAMALLQGKCDPITIKLLARWHSDAMMRYLHQQSVPIMKNLASLMFNGGQYSFLPEEWVPSTPISPD